MLHRIFPTFREGRIYDRRASVAQAASRRFCEVQRRAPIQAQPDASPDSASRIIMPTILIVEDEAKMRRLLELNLGEDGFDTRSAPDAEAALDLLLHEPVDLVLPDLKLPGMGGLEFLHTGQRANAALPVIVMTAFGRVEP